MKGFQQKPDTNSPINPDEAIFSSRWLLGRTRQGCEALQMADTFGKKNGRNAKVSGLQGGKVLGDNPAFQQSPCKPLGSQWKITAEQLGSDLCLEQGVDKPPGDWTGVAAVRKPHPHTCFPSSACGDCGNIFPCFGKHTLICSLFSWHQFRSLGVNFNSCEHSGVTWDNRESF